MPVRMTASPWYTTWYPDANVSHIENRTPSQRDRNVASQPPALNLSAARDQVGELRTMRRRAGRARFFVSAREYSIPLQGRLFRRHAGLPARLLG
jgi:hypothetical protein